MRHDRATRIVDDDAEPVPGRSWPPRKRIRLLGALLQSRSLRVAHIRATLPAGTARCEHYARRMEYQNGRMCNVVGSGRLAKTRTGALGRAIAHRRGPYA